MIDIDGCVIFSVVNRDYIELAEQWAKQVEKITKKTISFACADKQSYDLLNSKGFQCYDFQRIESGQSICYSKITFPNEHAVYTVSLKFKLALHLINSGVDCIYSDVDAIWVKNPLPFLNQEFSVAFQPGSFPEIQKNMWGFSACTGFVAFNSSQNVSDFLLKATSRFDGSDQAAFNETMLYDHVISWDKKPSNWEHCKLLGGWIDPIRGQCHISGLSFLALPHSFFQRHNTTFDDGAHAIICHPNSPKNQIEKINILRSMGLWND